MAVKVSDTGSGMNEEVRTKVFEPFFTTKEVGRGWRGLGLSRCFGFAKQSGGGVRINSRLREGTSVQIFLPRARVDVGNAYAQDSKACQLASERHHNSVGRRRRSGPRGPRAMLHELGHKVLEAGSGGAALDILQRGRGVEL